MSDDLEMEAAEYVIGTLDAAERAAFSLKLDLNGDVRRAVAGWERRFAGLADQLDQIQPSAEVWTRIEHLVATLPQQKRLTVVGGGLATGPKLKTSRDRWRAAAIAFGSVAAALVAFVLQREAFEPGRDNSAVSYIAAVNRGGDKPALLIRVDMKTRQVYVRPIAAETPSGHSLELWYIGDDKPPRSMGLIDKTPSTLSIPQGSSVTAATFAVSVEPQGGSKDKGPSGPVVYAGQLIKD